jgi:nucleotide-binding universal stress UspA family protein
MCSKGSMGQIERIIVGHDLGARGDAAAKSAIVLADHCHAALRLVHVIEPHHLYQMISHPMASEMSPEEIVQRAGAKLEAMGASPQLEHFRVEYEVRMGKPFVEIILASRAWQADLIVVGGPSRQHSSFLGSNGERVMRKAPVPVLVARKPLNANAKQFLVPTDFSAGAHKAAEEALALAKSFNGHISFLHVRGLTPRYTYYYEGAMAASMPILRPTPEDFEADWESFFSSLPLGNIPCENRSEKGHAATAIVQNAEAIHADLIVMGTHGRGGLKHMLLGSVAEEVARKASCPVLTIRSEAFQFEMR